MTESRDGRIIGFWESEEIVALIDKVAQNRGTDRSGFLREIVRQKLAELSFLPDEVKKSLGVKEVKIVG